MPEPAPPWTARTGSSPAPDLASYGECVDVDEHLVEADLAGSVAHVLGLLEAQLLTEEEAADLVDGLQQLAQHHAKGHLELDPALEDVHMNVEHQLGQLVGSTADKLHTARSRNDQIALDLVLYTRSRLVDLAQALHELATSLAQRAVEHAETPWPLHTHGSPGQPATLGYLLHAHAVRLRRDVANVLTVFHASAESPLGAGAGAGTTLPLDPAVSAGFLGLEAPENGLLATGARDGSTQAAQLAATAGRHAGDLAVDLLELVHDDGIELPAAYTTGSSIMPHKANPDGLELVRADAAKLASLCDAVERVVGGLGLGYERDLQRAKPPLVEALSLAPDTLGVLANLVDGFEANEATLGRMQAIEGVATTDALEALVTQGVAFRQAHQLVSAACHDAEAEESSIAQALAARLEAAGLDEAAQTAALAALEADPERRTSPGGPAPSVLAPALDELSEDLDTLGEAIEGAAGQAQAPAGLLQTPPGELIASVQEGAP